MVGNKKYFTVVHAPASSWTMIINLNESWILEIFTRLHNIESSIGADGDDEGCWLDLCYPTDNNFDDANVYHFVVNYIIPLCQPHPSKPYLSNQTQKLSSNQKFCLGPLSKDFQLSYLFYLHHKGNLIDLNDGPLYFYTIAHSC